MRKQVTTSIQEAGRHPQDKQLALPLSESLICARFQEADFHPRLLGPPPSVMSLLHLKRRCHIGLLSVLRVQSHSPLLLAHNAAKLYSTSYEHHDQDTKRTRNIGIIAHIDAV